MSLKGQSVKKKKCIVARWGIWEAGINHRAPYVVYCLVTLMFTMCFFVVQQCVCVC